MKKLSTSNNNSSNVEKHGISKALSTDTLRVSLSPALQLQSRRPPVSKHYKPCFCFLCGCRNFYGQVALEISAVILLLPFFSLLFNSLYSVPITLVISIFFLSCDYALTRKNSGSHFLHLDAKSCHCRCDSGIYCETNSEIYLHI